MFVDVSAGGYAFQYRALRVPRYTRDELLVSWHQERIEIQFQAWLCALAQAVWSDAIEDAG